MDREINKLKTVNVATIQNRIAEALGDLTQEEYSVVIHKIEYASLLTTHIQIEVSLHTGFMKRDEGDTGISL